MSKPKLFRSAIKKLTNIRVDLSIYNDHGRQIILSEENQKKVIEVENRIQECINTLTSIE